MAVSLKCSDERKKTVSVVERRVWWCYGDVCV